MGPRMSMHWMRRPARSSGRYSYTPAADVAPEACCGLVSRGVSFADNKVLFGTLDGYLVALDATSGKPVWKTKVVDYKGGAVITSPPLIVKDLAITGFGGGEYRRARFAAGVQHRQR